MSLTDFGVFMPKRLTDCPGEDCRAGSDRQSELNPTYYSEIPEEARAQIESRTVNGSMNSPVMRCNYCGCVYGRFPARNHIFGWLDSGVISEKWSSAKSL
jgi:hypothetical protein